MDSSPGIGLDLVSLKRFAEVLERGGQPFRDRVFTAREQAAVEQRASPCQHYAARFAAKEAVLKALHFGLGQGVSLLDIEILGGRDEAPRVELHGAAHRHAVALGVEAWSLSLTHCEETAGAVAFAHLAT